MLVMGALLRDVHYDYGLWMGEYRGKGSEVM